MSGFAEPVARAKLSAAREVLKSAGRPLPSPVREYFEPRFQRDFRHVQVLDNDAASASAAALGARAYSFGPKIVLNRRLGGIENSRDRAVLAHELMHVTEHEAIAAEPSGIERSDAPAERYARAAAQAIVSGGTVAGPTVGASPSLIHRDGGDPVPAPAPADPHAPSPEKPPPQAQPKQPKTYRQFITDMLVEYKFDLPILRDGVHAFLGPTRYTLDEITDLTTDSLHQLYPEVGRPDVWSAVYQTYRAKDAVAPTAIQWVVQALYAPQWLFLSSQAGAPPRQQSFQLSPGLNLPRHDPGLRGWEHTVALNLSLFNLDSGLHGMDVFQNLLASYQASYVVPFGPQYKIDDHSAVPWVQGSVFAQIAAGLGASYLNAPAPPTAYLGLLVQPSVGAQISVNIWKFQVIAQGSLVYSLMSPTKPSADMWSQTFGAQVGVGLGAAF